MKLLLKEISWPEVGYSLHHDLKAPNKMRTKAWLAEHPKTLFVSQTFDIGHKAIKPDFLTVEQQTVLLSKLNTKLHMYKQLIESR
jgi:hypothetical protein